MFRYIAHDVIEKQAMEQAKEEEKARQEGEPIPMRYPPFGSLLKGQDYENKDRISREDLFQTVMSIPELTEEHKGLKRGDVLDLIKEWDPDNTGFIDLRDIKGDLNDHMDDPNRYGIVLKSNVKEVCDASVVEKVPSRKAARRRQW